MRYCDHDAHETDATAEAAGHVLSAFVDLNHALNLADRAAVALRQQDGDFAAEAYRLAADLRSLRDRVSFLADGAS